MSYPQTVTAYAVNLEPSGLAYLRLQLSNGQWATLKPSSLEMTSLYLDILRNEKPVFFVQSRGLLYTGPEPVGENDESPK